MVWRERAGEGKSLFARRGRLPLLTGVAGVVWNVGALLSFGPRILGGAAPSPVIVALAFGALGGLPAVVVHSLLEGRETVAGRRVTRAVIASAYALSLVAAVMHLAAALDGHAVPSRAALWLLTGGFTSLTAALLLMTRRQPIGRRGVWVAALAIFAVSAFHFGRHGGEESWWVELIGHHASLPLALAILHQDYRFALADLFLKNAIALLLLMGVSLALFSGVDRAAASMAGSGRRLGSPRHRVVRRHVDDDGGRVSQSAAVGGPAGRSRRAARPDYDAVLRRLVVDLDAAETEDGVVLRLSGALTASLGVTDPRVVDDPFPVTDRRMVATGPDLRTLLPASGSVVLLRLQTVENPHRAPSRSARLQPAGACCPTMSGCSSQSRGMARGGSIRCASRKSAWSGMCASSGCSGSRPKPSCGPFALSSTPTFSSTR